MTRFLSRVFLALLLFAPPVLRAQATGVVTVTPGNTPLAGVLVSDGMTVVKTDTSGRFTLPAPEGTRFIVVTTPVGHRAARGFFHRYTGAEGAYDFVLEKSPLTGGAFSFIQLADTELHQHSDWNGGWLDNLKEQVQTTPVAFVMHTGDICYEKGMRFHAAEVNTATLRTEVRYGIGNHDLVKWGNRGEALFEELFGPVWYSFDVGNVHFVMTPMLSGDVRPSYNSAQVVRWLKNDLAQVPPGKPVVMFNHDLWLEDNRATFKASDGGVFDFSRYNVKAWIFGHWHSHVRKVLAGSGIVAYCASTPDKGGIDHSAAAYRVYHVDADGNVRCETRYTHLENQLQPAAPASGETALLHAGKIQVRASVYHTAANTRGVEAAVVRDGVLPRWVALSADTDFAWSAEVPAAPGKQSLWLRATLANGTVLTRRTEFTAVSSSGAAVPKEDWPGLRGNAGHNRHGSIPLQGKPELVWSANTGGNVFMVSPVVGDGAVFIATADDDTATRCAVVALDAVTGRQRWKFPVKNAVKSGIAYEAGVVLAADVEGNLYALDAKTGALRWGRRLRMGSLPPLYQGLVVEAGVVYAGSQRGLCAVSVADGQVLWENDAWRGGEATPATHTLGSGVLTASSHWRGLYGHDAKSGKLLWSHTSRELRFRDGGATHVDGKFYIASTNQIFVLDAVPGKILQSKKHDYNLHAATTPLVTADKIIIGTADKGVVAFDRVTLKESWRHHTDPALVYTVSYSKNHVSSVETSPVLSEGIVFVGASDGSFYGLRHDTGDCVWARKTGSPVFSSPALSGNMLYWADFAGNVYGFRLGDLR